MKLPARTMLIVHHSTEDETPMIVPFLRNLRHAYPHAQIDLMLDHRYRELLEGCPYVNQFISMQRGRLSASGALQARSGFGNYIRAIQQIRSEQYQTVFVMNRSFTDSLMVWAAGIPRRIGHAPALLPMLLSDRVPYPEQLHTVDRFLEFLRLLDIPIGSKTLELWPTEEGERRMHSLMANVGWKAKDIKIVIHAAARHSSEQWPLERFEQVMAVLQKRYGARFIYIGSAADSAIYAQIESYGPFNGLNLCGTMTVRESLSAYRSADLFFGVASDAMYKAVAVGVPVVALADPADESAFGPWGEDHIVITKRSSSRQGSGRDNTCMMLISSEDAVEALERRIREILPKEIYY